MGFAEAAGEIGCDDETAGVGALGIGRTGATRFVAGFGGGGISGASGRSVSEIVGVVEESETVGAANGAGGG
jgi:hypothetical protein